jgi:signal transduction histidine kinase
MMTLSLLADSVRNDHALSAAARRRMEIVNLEMFRIVELIAGSLAPDAATTGAEMIDVREIADEAAELTGLAYGTAVTVDPGAPAVISISAPLLRRVLRNLVDNAVRAAGPDGRVTIRIEKSPETILEISDTGPGFGDGPADVAGLGLTVVRALLQAAGGRIDIADDPRGGARVRVIFSADPAVEPQAAVAVT